MDLERYRKDAKALLRAYRRGEPTAVARARGVTGFRNRFQLSDAQHVVAVEAGYRSWPELKRAAEQPRTIDSGLEYTPGDPVVLHITYRRFPYVSDGGAAVEKARRPGGWRAAAERIADERIVNVSRGGVVSLPVVPKGPGFDAIARRIAEASVELYDELLELDA